MSGSTDREILNIEEAAKLLGVSVKTFNKVLHSESLPARKIGREWKFSRRALIEWVGSGTSDEFYRETSSTIRAGNGVQTAGAGSRGAATPKGKRPRRTPGWSLDLD
jgi:excisionase family DNA binding protein